MFISAQRQDCDVPPAGGVPLPPPPPLYGAAVLLRPPLYWHGGAGGGPVGDLRPPRQRRRGRATVPRTHRVQRLLARSNGYRGQLRARCGTSAALYQK
eukprot:1195851-Prorocentrum_minimum.AAC.1